MTQEEILQGNRLIAEFMDCEYDDISETYDTGILKLVEPEAYGDEQFSSLLYDYELDYHSSWDWLMPCIKKCLDINEEELDDWEKQYENINDTLYQVEISQTYQAVIEFIKWYNQQPKS